MEREAPDEAKDTNRDEDNNGALVITDLKQGVKNPNRVNVFINEKFALSLDLTQVVDFHLKIGLEISRERLEELRKASEYGKLYQRALEWVLARPRSEQETRDYLKRKLKTSSSSTRPSRPSSRGTDLAPVVARVSSEDISEFSDNIVGQLKAKGYLDDRRFAEFWVENRFVKKGVSNKRLEMELMKKGIAKEIIEEVMQNSDRDEADELQKMYAKKRLHYDDEKLIAYLCRQGFSYDAVREIVLGSA